MSFHPLADLVVVVHASFVLFIVLGGLLGLRWPRVIWLHGPAVAWGIVVELMGWECPLTPLEQRLRAVGDGARYTGAFVDRYLLPILYPENLTRSVQVALGGGVLIVNLLVYGWVLRRRTLARGATSR